MPAAATIFVASLPEMTTFYCEHFQLAVIDDAPGDYAILHSDAWTVSLVQMSRELMGTMTITDPPARRQAAAIKLSFEVPSIQALRATMPRPGGGVDPAESEWEFLGFKHCDCLDPESNVVQLRERL